MQRDVVVSEIHRSTTVSTGIPNGFCVYARVKVFIFPTSDPGIAGADERRVATEAVSADRRQLAAHHARPTTERHPGRRDGTREDGASDRIPVLAQAAGGTGAALDCRACVYVGWVLECVLAFVCDIFVSAELRKVITNTVANLRI